MKEFEQLLEVIDTLLAPDGCPWDRKQTLKSVRPYLIEEGYEIIDAINNQDTDNLKEELGDLFFVLLFVFRLFEKETGTPFQDILLGAKDKLIRRHPHVFGGNKLDNEDEVSKQWEEIKNKEKKRTHPFDNIPKAMPTLLRAEKIMKKMKKMGYSISEKHQVDVENEEELGENFLSLINSSVKRKLNIDSSLRKVLNKIEKEVTKKAGDSLKTQN